MKRILIGYDGTEPASRALARAVELAKTFGSQLAVTSVAPVMVGGSRGFGAIDPTDPPDVHEQELVRAKAFIEEHSLKAQYLPAVGMPAEAIIEAAEATDADLIVVGTGEPSLIERLLGQSVSESVQRRAHCDVLIVH